MMKKALMLSLDAAMADNLSRNGADVDKFSKRFKTPCVAHGPTLHTLTYAHR